MSIFAVTKKIKNMKKILSLFLLIFIFISCKERPIEYEFKKQVIVAKKEIVSNGNSKFIMAFEDRSDYDCTFGEFNAYQLKDTVLFKREKDWFWFIVDSTEFANKTSFNLETKHLR